MSTTAETDARSRTAGPELPEVALADGHGRRNGKVRVAVIGVGNCASALVQGVHYYRDAKPDERVPGLMHTDLGGYHISDIAFQHIGILSLEFHVDKLSRPLL